MLLGGAPHNTKWYPAYILHIEFGIHIWLMCALVKAFKREQMQAYVGYLEDAKLLHMPGFLQKHLSHSHPPDEK